MAREERQKLIADLEKDRGDNVVVSYITSTRGNFEIQIADDVPPLLCRHLVKHADRAKKGVDLFIHSNGGSRTVPWRMVNLIREFTEKFVVLSRVIRSAPRLSYHLLQPRWPPAKPIASFWQ